MTTSVHGRQLPSTSAPPQIHFHFSVNELKINASTRQEAPLRQSDSIKEISPGKDSFERHEFWLFFPFNMKITFYLVLQSDEADIWVFEKVNFLCFMGSLLAISSL